MPFPNYIKTLADNDPVRDTLFCCLLSTVKAVMGTFLVAQCLGLHFSTAGGPAPILVQGTKILQATDPVAQPPALQKKKSCYGSSMMFIGASQVTQC